MRQITLFDRVAALILIALLSCIVVQTIRSCKEAHAATIVPRIGPVTQPAYFQPLLKPQPDTQPLKTLAPPLSTYREAWLNELWEAICTKESRGKASAFRASENAAGIAQIRPCVVEDVNMILGVEAYTLKDRWDIDKSREMFDIYTTYWASRPEIYARIWNGGPTGFKKKSTVQYWKEVKELMR